LLITIGKGLARILLVADLLRTLKEARDMKVYLSRTRPDEASVEREACLRRMYDTLLARLDLDVPPEAIQPVVDPFVAMALAEWDAEFVSRSPQAPGVVDHTGA
jgi:hypothetical protein